MNDIEKAIVYLKKSIQYVLNEKDEPLNETEEVIKIMNTAISALKKQLNGGWIPVSERLPSEEEWNRFGISHPNRRKFLCTVKIGDYEPQVRELCFNIFYHWEYYSENYDEYVIAWQPLPEPYKEETNGTRNMHII